MGVTEAWRHMARRGPKHEGEGSGRLCPPVCFGPIRGSQCRNVRGAENMQSAADMPCLRPVSPFQRERVCPHVGRHDRERRIVLSPSGTCMSAAALRDPTNWTPTKRSASTWLQIRPKGASNDVMLDLADGLRRCDRGPHAPTIRPCPRPLDL